MVVNSANSRNFKEPIEALQNIAAYFKTQLDACGQTHVAPRYNR